MDRIWEAYEGSLGEDIMRESRARIHWICKNVQGKTVLDVGCSQGICSILLGREDYKVTGLDVYEPSIAYADQKLALEQEETKKNVIFHRASFLHYDESNCFDTIIMAEILEHLINPEVFLRKAASILNAEGRLIITVPFGINDWPDHKQTYYFFELYELLENTGYAVENIEFLSKWIGYIATRKKGSPSLPINTGLLKQLEDAFFILERSVRDQLKQSMQEVQDYKKRLKALEEEHKKSISELKELTDDHRRKIEALHNEIKQTEIDYEASLEALRREREEIEKQYSVLLHEEERKRTSELAELRKQLEQSKEKYAVLLDQNMFINEREKAQSREFAVYQATANQQLYQAKRQRAGWEREYQALAGSKLGRIQVAYWGRKKAKRGHKRSLKTWAKKSPALVAIVRFLRGQKQDVKVALAQAQQPKQEKRVDDFSAFGMDFYKRVERTVQSLPKSSESRSCLPLPVRVGWITDDILYDAFKDAASGILISPGEWQQQISEIDLLFIISGWKGVHGEWKGFAREGSEKRKIIYEIIDSCREKGIPTVFHSVEDPPNYERFIGIGKRCDYVFTVCEEVIPQYRTDCGHDRVALLTYGINPLFHNPVGFRSADKLPEVLFAGSWMDKYPERCKDVQILFDGVLSSGKKLKVIDRNLLLKQPEYSFPNKYAAYISPPLNHDALQLVQRLFDWSLNLNSVKDSATMFANRVFEMQASGNLLISNYSVGVNSLAPLVFTTQHSEEVSAILNAFTQEEIYERQVMGIRFAMRGNTCFERMAEVLDRIGISYKLTHHKVAVVGEGKNVEDAFVRQTYEHKELLNETDIEQRYDEFDMIAFFSDNAFYGDFYLEDMCNAFKYTNAEYVTKAAYRENGELKANAEHDFVDVIADKTRTIFWRECFTAQELLHMRPDTRHENGYSIDHFEYDACVQPQHIRDERTYKLTVVVPVYNNGLHLYGKAFNSLRRSSIFHDMEILLVDDGSTDQRTLAVVRTLEREYLNVRAYFFGDGGSGSASRPRNKGAELASAPYITYLDPDNEAINDAYAQMYRRIEGSDYDMIVGNMLRFRKTEELANYYRFFRKHSSDAIVSTDTSEFLKEINFTPMSIQAMVIKTSLIKDNKLTQVVGAVGQDSFFSWQLIYHAKKICAVDTPAHIYYALVGGSTVNTVKPKYFRRSLLQERVQRDWLEEAGLLEAYMEKRFTAFFRDWYLVKLNQAAEEDRAECAAILREIYELYADVCHDKDAKIEAFLNLKAK